MSLSEILTPITFPLLVHSNNRNSSRKTTLGYDTSRVMWDHAAINKNDEQVRRCFRHIEEGMMSSRRRTRPPERRHQVPEVERAT